MNQHVDRTSAPTESSVQRAKKRIGEMKLHAAATGDKDPLSEASQLAAAVNKADGIAKALRAKRQELHDSKLYTHEGITDALAADKQTAQTAAEAVREQLNKSGATLWAEADAVSEPEPIPFGDAESRTLKLFNDLPSEQKARVKAEAIAGRHPDLARALVSAPQFSTQLDGRTRDLLSRGFETPETAAKKDAIMEKAQNHGRAALAVDAAIAEINAV